jgi:hypothetical protein
MSRVSASTVVPGRISEAEALWYDLSRWPSFVDGFSHVVRSDEAWPQAGQLVWDSTPNGRGRVVERVTRHELRTGHASEVEDERLQGIQTVAFEGAGEDTRVTLSLEYALKQTNLVSPLVDLFFVRRALRDSLERTLARFARERRGDVELYAA